MELRALAILALAASCLWPAILSAQSAENQGYAIAKAADAKNRGFQDYTASGRMVLRAGGGASERRFDFKAREVGSKTETLMVFNWPGDVRDTALLTHSQTSGADSQWIYLPATRQVRRISSSSRSGSFLGSEFAFEDMVDQDVGNFSYKWIGKEGCCNLVERVPKFSSGYSRQVVSYDSGNGLPVKIDYEFKRGSGRKTLTIAGYRSYSGVWRPSTMTMVNHVSGKSTALNWSNYRFNVGVNPSDFTTRGLERGQ